MERTEKHLDIPMAFYQMALKKLPQKFLQNLHVFFVLCLIGLMMKIQIVSFRNYETSDFLVIIVRCVFIVCLIYFP